MTRTEVIDAVLCPACSAPKGRTCQGRRGDRETLHAERWRAAEALNPASDTPTAAQLVGALSPELREKIERELRGR